MVNAKKLKLSTRTTGPGVYLFKKRGVVLYVGKANNLRARLRSYFLSNVPAKIKELIQEATNLKLKTTLSEPEALIVEAQLIKKHQPKYNVIFRDDKNYFFVGLTKEKYPRVFLTHQLRLKKYSGRAAFIGPFTEGRALKSIIRAIRQKIPFCTCRSLHDKLCLNYHLGRCMGVCCVKPKAKEGRYRYLDTKTTHRRYMQNIRYLKAVLQGRRTSLMNKLEARMRAASRAEDFERAAELRDLIKHLKNILAHKHISFKNEFLDTALTMAQTKEALKLPTEPRRIEAYDISNIAGTFAVGTMIVFIDGSPDRDGYRKFKIKTVKGANDVAMMREMLTRRFKHEEWPKPDVVFIDGGIAQFNIAKEILSRFGVHVPVIAFAKGLENVFASTLQKQISLGKLPTRVQHFIVAIKDEVHRFSIAYYRSVHTRAMIR